MVSVRANTNADHTRLPSEPSRSAPRLCDAAGPAAKSPSGLSGVRWSMALCERDVRSAYPGRDLLWCDHERDHDPCGGCPHDTGS
jgi:hypothetical protein